MKGALNPGFASSYTRPGAHGMGEYRRQNRFVSYTGSTLVATTNLGMET
jgi:hypothetical protein